MRLVIENGKIEFNGNVLLEHINFDVNDNSKIAIIGRNGCGKTSLLKVIQGELDLVFDSSNSEGYISKSNDFSIGFLKQISFNDEDITLEESILECYKEIIKLENKLNDIAKKMETEVNNKLIEEYSKISELFENMDGYYYKKEYHTVLKKFGFTPDMFTKKIGEFSGGERTKIAFVKLLLSKPDLLLLDEPTNHLDIEAIEWLEEYLKAYKKAFIVVSHDREFINKIAKNVYEIEYNTITKYSGNYNDYLIEKEIRYKSNLKRYQEQQKEIKHEQELIDRFRYKATKAKMVQSRIKQLDKMEIISAPRGSENKTFKMNINPLSESGKEVVNIKDLEFGYINALSKVNLTIYKGQKIAIVGDNGTGKSTLLKTLMNIVKPISGEYKFGFNVKIGYFDQQVATKVSEKTILEDYISTYPHLTNNEARSDLGAFLFFGEDVNKRLNVLSGGEVVRLGLAKILKTRPNFLILDEPTNHMDIYSKERIEKMLKDYKGTILFVSHDRYFVRKVADSILLLNNNITSYFPYGYEQYLACKDNKKFEFKEEIKTVNKVIKNNDKSSLKKDINKIEKEIKETEDKIKVINEEFEKEEVYSDFMLTRELEEELENLDDTLKILMRKWEELVSLMEE